MLLLLALSVILCPSELKADDAVVLEDLVVTATRLPRKTDSLASSVSVISGDELRKGGATDLTDALQGSAGVEVTRNGGPGQSASVLLRGAKAEQVLVLIDGVPMNDPLSPSRGFDFSSLALDDIESVEILRGPQSVLYGSDAIGGVILIRTKGAGEKAHARVGGGSFGTADAALDAYGFHASYFRTDGISAADSRLGNQEPDGARRYSLGGKKEYVLGENDSLSVLAMLNDLTADTDARGGAGGDKRNTYSRKTVLNAQASLRDMKAGDLLENNYTLSYAHTDREDNTAGPSFFLGDLKKLATLHHWRGSSKAVVSGGLEAQSESGRTSDIPSTHSAETYSVFLQNVWETRPLFGELGARLDHHSRFGKALSFRAGLGYWVSPGRTKLKATAATGFKAPSLYQLYSPYGAVGLKPEKSFSWDAGVERFFRAFGGDGNLELGIFSNRYRDMIDFDPANSRYSNTAAARSYGIELSARLAKEKSEWNAESTYLRTRDLTNGKELLRRPRLTQRLGFTRAMSDLWRLGATLSYTGKRKDNDPVLLTEQTLPEFFLVSAFTDGKLSGGWKWNLKAENLFDRRYQLVSGYGTPGRSVYAGISAEL